jgi:gliding motility-associated-like protein
MYRILLLILLVFFNTLLASAAPKKKKKPKIVGQQAVSIAEGTSKTLSTEDLIIEIEETEEDDDDDDDDNDDNDDDDDDEGDETLSLEVDGGDNYSVAGTTVTPDVDYVGILSIPVRVIMDKAKSNKFDLQLTVEEENVAPVITAQAALAVSENASLDLTLNDFTVSDPDNTYPQGFTLYALEGENYSLSETTVTPASGFNGTLNVQVFVNDGASNSDIYPAQIQVNAVKNETPTITGQNPLQINEEQAITIELGNLIVSDPDNAYPAGFTLTVSTGENYTLSENTLTPLTNYNGTLSVPVTVNDGTTDSAPFNVQITVNALNDAPQITAHRVLAINENEVLTLGTNDLTIIDPDNNAFTLSVGNGSNYTVSGTTITPSAGFNGILTVPVTVSDGNASSNTFDAQVSVNAVNSAPTITGQNPLSTNEEAGLAIELGHLIVSDADNTYPAGFTLSVATGENYTVSGNTVTPATDFSGSLSVPVTVNDGTANSAPFNVQITVNAVNDAPQVTAQAPLAIGEDELLTLNPTHLTIVDPDNNAFTLSVGTGTNYTVSGTTITPTTGFNGLLTVPVTVSDGVATSNAFHVQVTVNVVNNPPTITGQANLEIGEEEPFTIVLEHLVVSDPDNTYPTEFTLSVSGGNNYTVSGTTVTPAPNYAGTLSVPVTVNDGQNSSDPFNLQITVTPANDSPVITGQETLSTPEDQPIAITLQNLIVTDLDNTYPNGFTFTLGQGENYSIQGSSVVPAENYSGALSVPVTVSDGTTASNTFGLAIQVIPVNDAPSITGQNNLQLNENSALDVKLGDFQVSDPDNTFPTGFSLAINLGNNYTVSGTTITPTAGFSGTLSVGVTISDGTNTSGVFNAQVSVLPVNDPPQITSQSALQINEEQPLTVLLSHLTVTDQDNPYPQGFTLALSEGQNYTFSGAVVTPAKDFTGVLTVPVTVNDGSTNSNVFNLQITVNPVNDPPVITSQTPLSIFKNKPLEILLSHLKISDPDDTYPADFTLTVAQGQNYTAIGNTITPATEFTGTLTIPVTVNDGAASSPPFNIKVEVTTPPNVAPVITAQVSLTTYENQPLTLQLSNLVVTDPDNRFPDDFNMTIFSGNNYIVEGNTITPASDFTGTLTVKVTVSDKQATSAPFNLTVSVLPIADVPLITSQAFLRVNEDDSLVLDFSHLIVIDPDNSYPTGFTLSISPGSNYTVKNRLIKPSANFNGYLSVPVTVNDGANTSAPYQLTILVDPINDAPTINDSNNSLVYIAGNGGLNLFDEVVIEDVDDDSIALAEIAFIPSDYQAGLDSLSFGEQAGIRPVFDRSTGILILFGNASLASYQSLIRTIQYHYNSESDPGDIQKTITVRVSDGKVSSRPFTKLIRFDETLITLDIPDGFTPNGDGANDTWSIRFTEANAALDGAEIRVYNNRGALVFETKGFANEWDGRMNGTFLPADSYFYTIDLNGGKTKNRYKGIVTILR